jgi:type I restriction enzyme R subunit
VALLPEFVVSDPTLRSSLTRCTPEKLTNATPAELNAVRDQLAPHMKNKKRQNTFLTLDLADMIDLSGYIMLTKSGEQVYVKEYRRRVEERILHLVEHHPTLLVIARGEAVDEEQLIELERVLQQDLAGGNLEVTQENLRRAYGIHIESFLDLLRHVLDMDAIPSYEQIVTNQFQQFIIENNYNADQIRFLRAVQSVFLRKRHLALADLYQEPLTNFGADAVDRWFTDDEKNAVLDLAKKLEM